MTSRVSMATHMITTALLILCICFFNVGFSQNIVERPRDLTVREGRNVLFRCIIRNLQSNQNVYWFRLSTRRFITVNRMVNSNVPQGNRLSILGNANLGEYFLQIRNVELADAGTYRCGYAVPNLSFTFAGAVLEVQRPPNEGSPMCSVSPNGLNVGDVATITCRSEGGQPPASLAWRLEETVLTELKESRNVLSVVVSAEHNGQEFICDAESPAIDEPRFCSVTLLSIRPDVRVEPPLGIAEVGGRIVFTCIAFGLPEIVRYEWLFNNKPVDDIQRLEVSLDGRTLIINDIKLEDDESPVHCTATTTQGLSGTSGALLRVEDFGTFTVEPTTINATDFNNDTMEGQAGKTSPVVIAIIVIAVIIGQVLIVIIVYVIHRCVNRMMTERKARRRSTSVMRDMNVINPQPARTKATDMEENIYVGGVSIPDRSDIDPETGAPKVFYNSITDSSFDSMGEGVYSQGPTTPHTDIYLGEVGIPLTTPPERPERGRPSLTSPPSPLYSNPTDLDQGIQQPQGRLPHRTEPPTSPSNISESPYGYDEVPFVEAEEEHRRPPPPTSTPPRPPVVVTSPPPNKPPPRVPADQRRSNPQGRVPPQNNQYCGLNPDRPDSRYLSLRHYDEAYSDDLLQQGARLSGEEYSPYDHPVTDHDDDHHVDDDEHHEDYGYVYELPPANSTPDELYDVPPDAEKREYTFMGSNLPPK
ncbi:uncharacterized protein LOC100891983 [Strongylocentrotus purpuratus]|uniref:Ig-like domain-containing protein n=1 Tax=Strongylocentrotus purpuratus TaxID=7668 RepID=A0A7M7LLG6_STRPU|nr:uncharacterized protein LOC100891983 [Strongylocentrotus purpuratus]